MRKGEKPDQLKQLFIDQGWIKQDISDPEVKNYLEGLPTLNTAQPGEVVRPLVWDLSKRGQIRLVSMPPMTVTEHREAVITDGPKKGTGTSQTETILTPLEGGQSFSFWGANMRTPQDEPIDRTFTFNKPKSVKQK
jgi:hypothetical protein